MLGNLPNNKIKRARMLIQSVGVPPFPNGLHMRTPCANGWPTSRCLPVGLYPAQPKLASPQRLQAPWRSITPAVVTAIAWGNP